MARVIIDDPEQIIPDWIVWARIVLVGLALGLLQVMVTVGLDHFIVAPLVCSGGCEESTVLSGNIAIILVAVTGLAIAIKMQLFRPLIIAAGTAAALWGIAGWVRGLSWGEAALWTMLLYGVIYLTLSWITRHYRLPTIILSTAAIVIISRVIITL